MCHRACLRNPCSAPGCRACKPSTVSERPGVNPNDSEDVGFQGARASGCQIYRPSSTAPWRGWSRGVWKEASLPLDALLLLTFSAAFWRPSSRSDPRACTRLSSGYNSAMKLIPGERLGRSDMGVEGPQPIWPSAIRAELDQIGRHGTPGASFSAQRRSRSNAARSTSRALSAHCSADVGTTCLALHGAFCPGPRLVEQGPRGISAFRLSAAGRRLSSIGLRCVWGSSV